MILRGTALRQLGLDLGADTRRRALAQFRADVGCDIDPGFGLAALPAARGGLPHRRLAGRRVNGLAGCGLLGLRFSDFSLFRPGCGFRPGRGLRLGLGPLPAGAAGFAAFAVFSVLAGFAAFTVFSVLAGFSIFAGFSVLAAFSAGAGLALFAACPFFRRPGLPVTVAAASLSAAAVFAT